ncbi:MAG: heme-binding protein [Verrucomicrobia bacterium]|nr:heme-binding protein [Verrucomicrobiota bacterium]
MPLPDSGNMIRWVNQRTGQLLLLLLTAVPAFGQMTSNDVATVMAQAVTRASQVSPNSVIAVVDREGFVLGVWSVNGATPATAAFTNLVAEAIARAGTASFLSSDQHAFSSRTALFIVQQNFPPGVKNKPPGPLVGVNFSNLPFTDVNRYKNPTTYVPGMNGGTNGGVVPTPLLGGLDGFPGGVPLFKNGKLIGGVGVAGDGSDAVEVQNLPAAVLKRDTDEDVALAGQIGFEPAKKILGSHVFIDGIRVPYVRTKTRLDLNAVAPLGSIGTNLAEFPITNSPLVSYPLVVVGDTTNELRAPIIDDPIPGTIDGQPRLTASEVTNILKLAAQRAAITRAGIRLPHGQPAQVFISVVNNPNAAGVAPSVLGTLRTPGATMFSWDVSVQKARTAVFFSDTNRAYSSRTVGFLAQSLYPPGIVNTSPGPFFGWQEIYSLFQGTNPLNNAAITNSPTLNPSLPNGITIFPGGFPLYRNGVLIGAIGVSGDGVDQDDLIAASGTVAFLPPDPIRADRSFFRGTRLPYAKFPRNPSL